MRWKVTATTTIIPSAKQLHNCGKIIIIINDNNNNCIERRLHRELSSTRTLKWPGRNRVQITWHTSSAFHVQHVVCHVVRRDSSAIKFNRVEIELILALFYWLKPIKEGRKPECQETGKPLTTSFRKCHILKPKNSSWGLKPHWWQARKADLLTITPRVAHAIDDGNEVCKKWYTLLRLSTPISTRKTVMTDQKREYDGDGLDGLDGPQRCQTQHLDERVHVHAPQWHVTQVDVVRLVLDRHEEQQQAVDQLHM